MALMVALNRITTVRNTSPNITFFPREIRKTSIQTQDVLPESKIENVYKKKAVIEIIL